MHKSKISFVLLMLCASIMPLTVYQIGTVNGRSPGSDLPTISPPTARPTVNLPTVRPTINQPTAQPTFSFTRQSVQTSFSITRNIVTSFTPPPISSISFTRSVATSFTQPAFTSISFSRISTSLSLSTVQWTGMSFTRSTVTSIVNPTVSWTITTVNNYQTYGGLTFQYPSSYNYNVGSFTLDRTLIGPNGVPCTYYAYFEFNAYAGQQLQAQVWTTGATVSYIVVPQNLVPILQQMGCGYAQSGPRSQAHSFNSQVTLSWTAPETGPYVIIFYSLTPYSGPIYFVPGPQ